MATASDDPTTDPGTDPTTDPGSGPETDPGTDRPERGSGTRFVFVDTEATGLDHQRHELTEVAWVVRYEDGREVERRFFPEHTTDGADATALELTRYEERIAPQERAPASEWLAVFLEDATDAVLVGAVPDFDAKHLERMCRKLGLEPTWDHHLLDVETLALPLLAPGPEAPRSLARTCAGLGITHDKDQAHGALYDAQQAMRVFDRVWELIAEHRTTGQPLPAPIALEPDEAGQDDGATGDTATDEPAKGDTATDDAAKGGARQGATANDGQPRAAGTDQAPSGAEATSS